jgi:hypothetical protein
LSFRISDSLSLPKEAVAWVLSFIAKRGAGKTYAAADLAEEMLKAKIPIVVIDGMGIWYGLRVSSDGKNAGLPIVVFGGDHADLPLVPEKAAEIAKAVVESNISCVLDISGFSKYIARRIVRDFLNELYRLNRAERHVFIEEADLWAPQRPLGPEENLCLSAVDNFVRRGGNHNLGCTLITQRSAVLNKDILTQSDCLVILRTLAPQDKKAIQAWVEEQTDEDKTKVKKWYDTLKELENGQAYVWHPEKPAIFAKVQFRKRETFHATREFVRSPQASKIVLMDVDEFIQRFKSVFEVKPEHKLESERKIDVKPELKIKIAPKVEVKQPPARPELPPGPPVTLVETSNTSVTQTLPNVVINQFKPTLTVPVEVLDEPTTALGKVVVVLKNDAQNKGRQDKWSINRTKMHVRDHGWDDEGVEDAIAQLIRWEILVKQPSKYLRFYPERVQIAENNERLKVA